MIIVQDLYTRIRRAILERLEVDVLEPHKQGIFSGISLELFREGLKAVCRGRARMQVWARRPASLFAKFLRTSEQKMQVLSVASFWHKLLEESNLFENSDQQSMLTDDLLRSEGSTEAIILRD